MFPIKKFGLATSSAMLTSTLLFGPVSLHVNAQDVNQTIESSVIQEMIIEQPTPIRMLFPDLGFARVIVDYMNRNPVYPPYTLDSPIEQQHVDDLKMLRFDRYSGGYRFESIKGIGYLRNLELLILQGQPVTDLAAEELATLQKLESLNIAQIAYEGPIPAELGQLSSLVSLTLQPNYSTGASFTGPIPKSLGKLTNLVNLDLQANRLTGEIPAELGELEYLQHLDLSGNLLTGEIPSELVNLRNLRRLLLNSNLLQGKVPELFAEEDPWVLYLQHNRFEDFTSFSGNHGWTILGLDHQNLGISDLGTVKRGESLTSTLPTIFKQSYTLGDILYTNKDIRVDGPATVIGGGQGLVSLYTGQIGEFSVTLTIDGGKGHGSTITYTYTVVE